ncbi:unnamed protein product, partial [Mesorhabditis spiculigera]
MAEEKAVSLPSEPSSASAKESPPLGDTDMKPLIKMETDGQNSPDRHLDLEAKCPICLGVPNDPSVPGGCGNALGHRCCYSCLRRWFKTNPTCPVCGIKSTFIKHQLDSGGVIETIESLQAQFFSEQMALESKNVPLDSEKFALRKYYNNLLGRLESHDERVAKNQMSRFSDRALNAMRKRLIDAISKVSLLQQACQDGTMTRADLSADPYFRSMVYDLRLERHELAPNRLRRNYNPEVFKRNGEPQRLLEWLRHELPVALNQLDGSIRDIDAKIEALLMAVGRGHINAPSFEQACKRVEIPQDAIPPFCHEFFEFASSHLSAQLWFENGVYRHREDTTVQPLAQEQRERAFEVIDLDDLSDVELHAAREPDADIEIINVAPARTPPNRSDRPRKRRSRKGYRRSDSSDATFDGGVPAHLIEPYLNPRQYNVSRPPKPVFNSLEDFLQSNRTTHVGRYEHRSPEVLTIEDEADEPGPSHGVTWRNDFDGLRNPSSSSLSANDASREEESRYPLGDERQRRDYEKKRFTESLLDGDCLKITANEYNAILRAYNELGSTEEFRERFISALRSSEAAIRSILDDVSSRASQCSQAASPRPSTSTQQHAPRGGTETVSSASHPSNSRSQGSQSPAAYHRQAAPPPSANGVAEDGWPRALMEDQDAGPRRSKRGRRDLDSADDYLYVDMRPTESTHHEDLGRRPR